MLSVLTALTALTALPDAYAKIPGTAPHGELPIPGRPFMHAPPPVHLCAPRAGTMPLREPIPKP
jgi:hypothetical protein